MNSPSKKKIYFFIGLPRCGNTAIQINLEKLKLYDRVYSSETNEFINYLRNYIFFEKCDQEQILKKFDNINFEKKINILFIEGLTDPFVPFYKNSVDKNIKNLVNLIKARENKFDFKIILLKRGVSWLKSYWKKFGYFCFYKNFTWLSYKKFIVDQKKEFASLKKHGLIYPNINIISNFLHLNKIKHRIFLFADFKKNTKNFIEKLIHEIFDDNKIFYNYEKKKYNESHQNYLEKRKIIFLQRIFNLKNYKFNNFKNKFFLLKLEIYLFLYSVLFIIKNSVNKKTK